MPPLWSTFFCLFVLLVHFAATIIWLPRLFGYSWINLHRDSQVTLANERPRFTIGDLLALTFVLASVAAVARRRGVFESGTDILVRGIVSGAVVGGSTLALMWAILMPVHRCLPRVLGLVLLLECMAAVCAVFTIPRTTFFPTLILIAAMPQLMVILLVLRARGQRLMRLSLISAKPPVAVN